MSWAELFERAAVYGVTEEQVTGELGRQRGREADPDATGADEP